MVDPDPPGGDQGSPAHPFAGVPRSELSKVQRRLGRRREKKGDPLPAVHTLGKRPELPGDAELAAQMRARNRPLAEIARALDQTRERTVAILERPDTQQLILDIRKAIQIQHLAGVERLTDQLLNGAEKAIQDNDAKRAYFYLQAVHSNERTASSAAGEQRPQVQVANVIQVADAKGTVRELLDALEAHPAGH